MGFISDPWGYGSTFGMIFCRIMASIVSLPILSGQYMPMRLKIAIGFILSCSVFANESLKFTFVEGQWLSLCLMLFYQVLIGLGVGFLTLFFWEIFIMLGHIIAYQSGLSFANLVSTDALGEISILSQFYVLLITTIFFSLDGHLALIACLLDSFELIPLNVSIHFDSVFFFKSISWVFSKATQIALPSIATLLMVNLSFGLMSRIAGQLNIFSIGFSLTIVTGLMMVWITFFSLHEIVVDVFSQILLMINRYLEDFLHGI
jgi:flagellar biosynthetic protein FliR